MKPKPLILNIPDELRTGAVPCQIVRSPHNVSQACMRAGQQLFAYWRRNHYVKFLLAYEQQMQILASADEAETKLDEATLDASSWPTDSSGPAGHEDSAGEDAEPRSTTAPGGWSGQSLPGKAVTIIQDSKQESTGRPPLQIEAAAPTGALSLEAKAVLGMEAGVNSLGTSQELLADACIEEATPVNDDAAAGGLETPSRWC